MLIIYRWYFALSRPIINFYCTWNFMKQLFFYLHNTFIRLHVRYDAGESVKGGLELFQRIFSNVSLCYFPD